MASSSSAAVLPSSRRQAGRETLVVAGRLGHLLAAEHDREERLARLRVRGGTRLRRRRELADRARAPRPKRPVSVLRVGREREVALDCDVWQSPARGSRFRARACPGRREGWPPDRAAISREAAVETFPLKGRGRNAAKFFSVPTTITAIGCLPLVRRQDTVGLRGFHGAGRPAPGFCEMRAAGGEIADGREAVLAAPAARASTSRRAPGSSRRSPPSPGAERREGTSFVEGLVPIATTSPRHPHEARWHLPRPRASSRAPACSARASAANRPAAGEHDRASRAGTGRCPPDVNDRSPRRLDQQARPAALVRARPAPRSCRRRTPHRTDRRTPIPTARPRKSPWPGSTSWTTLPLTRMSSAAQDEDPGPQGRLRRLEADHGRRCCHPPGRGRRAQQQDADGRNRSAGGARAGADADAVDVEHLVVVHGHALGCALALDRVLPPPAPGDDVLLHHPGPDRRAQRDPRPDRSSPSVSNRGIDLGGVGCTSTPAAVEAERGASRAPRVASSPRPGSWLPAVHARRR